MYAIIMIYSTIEKPDPEISLSGTSCSNSNSHSHSSRKRNINNNFFSDWKFIYLGHHLSNWKINGMYDMRYMPLLYKHNEVRRETETLFVYLVYIRNYFDYNNNNEHFQLRIANSKWREREKKTWIQCEYKTIIMTQIHQSFCLFFFFSFSCALKIWSSNWYFTWINRKCLASMNYTAKTIYTYICLT